MTHIQVNKTITENLHTHAIFFNDMIIRKYT